jgi:hypothetical protein
MEALLMIELPQGIMGLSRVINIKSATMRERSIKVDKLT